MIEYLKAWRKWAKYNDNSKIYKILVLFGIYHSPSFEYVKRYKRW